MSHNEINEINEMWREHKRDRQDKKENNRASSTKMLLKKGIAFSQVNGGMHLIVNGKDGVIDFWPSTGKFIPRYKARSGRGIKNLLKLCL